MTKDKIISPDSNSILKYSPILLSMIALLSCYLLNKKMQSLNNQNDSILKIEEQFTKFIKSQTEINNENYKKINSVMSHLNHITQESEQRQQHQEQRQEVQRQEVQRQVEQRQVEQRQEVQQVEQRQEVQQRQEVKQVKNKEVKKSKKNKESKQVDPDKNIINIQKLSDGGADSDSIGDSDSD